MSQSWLPPTFSSKKNKYNKVIEPYVKYFDAGQADYDRFLLPFQLFNGILAFFIPYAICHWIVEDNLTVIHLALWLTCLFIPFYLPGLFLYAGYVKVESSTQLEIDQKGKFIHYQRGKTRLFFHKDQIESLAIFESLLLPYQLSYVKVDISGGVTIYISNLIIEPMELIDFYERKPTWHKKLFNAFPLAK